MSLLRVTAKGVRCPGTRRGWREGKAASKQTVLDCAAIICVTDKEDNGKESAP